MRACQDFAPGVGQAPAERYAGTVKTRNVDRAPQVENRMRQAEGRRETRMTKPGIRIRHSGFVIDSGFWFRDSGFWFRDSGFLLRMKTFQYHRYGAPEFGHWELVNPAATHPGAAPRTRRR